MQYGRQNKIGKRHLDKGHQQKSVAHIVNIFFFNLYKNKKDDCRTTEEKPVNNFYGEMEILKFGIALIQEKNKLVH